MCTSYIPFVRDLLAIHKAKLLYPTVKTICIIVHPRSHTSFAAKCVKIHGHVTFVSKLMQNRAYPSWTKWR